LRARLGTSRAFVVAMNDSIKLESVLASVPSGKAEQLGLFALLSLGIIESLANGLMSASEAVSRFYCADNCLFVRRTLKDKTADRIMSHSVQLPDLLEVLPVDEAQRQFLHELTAMRNLCLQLLESRRQAA